VASKSTTDIELRDPTLAAMLAWCVPGLGHLYQRRIGKGVLFMVCLWGTFFVGLVLGHGRNVYLKPGDYTILCQMGVGLAALPPLLQGTPSNVELNGLISALGRRWNIGLLYTMVAGLLNILVIFDAYAGPAYGRRAPEDEDPDAKDDTAENKASGKAKPAAKEPGTS